MRAAVSRIPAFFTAVLHAFSVRRPAGFINSAVRLAVSAASGGGWQRHDGISRMEFFVLHGGANSKAR